jgi:D-alanine transaminase
MKQQAAQAGAQEAIIVRENEVLEGASTSVLLVTGGVLVTPPNSHRILPGTTRDATLELAAEHLQIEIRAMSLEELLAADEVWLSAATRDVLPVTRIDDRVIGSGRPGGYWQRVSEAFATHRSSLAGTSAL